MALQESANVSSSSLGLSGAETPLPNSLSPPPPRDAERYEKRILPQVPRKRESGVSNFSKEVDEALATPDSVITPDEGSICLIYRPSPSPRSAPGGGDAEFAAALDHEKDDNQKREDLKLDIANLPTSVPGGVLSPKVAKVLGVLGPRESTPSGHKSPAKVRRLTGFELACEGSSQLNKRHRAKEHTQLHGEVSPVSNESSPYDHEEPKTAVSDLDAGPEADGWTYSPEPSPGYYGSRDAHLHSAESSVVPQPLRVAKPARPSRSPERKVLETPPYVEGSPRLRDIVDPGVSGHRTPSDKSSPDPYHEAAKQLAKGDAMATQQARQAERSQAEQLAVQQFVEAGRASGAGSHRSYDSRKLPSLPHQNYRHLPSDLPSGGIPSGDDERRVPVWRPSNYQQGSPRTVSASTFGRLTRRFHAQDPGQRSKSGDDTDNYPSTRTPDTGGSIPFSFGPSDKGGKANTRHRHSSSVMAKVFFGRTSASPTIPRTPATPTPPVPNNTPIEPSFRHTRAHHHANTHAHAHHANPYNLTPSPPSHSSSSAFPISTPELRVGTGEETAAAAAAKAKTKASMSALAAKTNDLVGAAAGFLSKSTANIGHVSMSGDERRRQRLKSSIRVLGDGGRVLAGGTAGSGVGSTPGSGVSAVSATSLGSGSGSGSPPAALWGAGGGGVAAGGYRGRLGSAPAVTGATEFAFASPSAGDGSLLGTGTLPGQSLESNVGGTRGSPQPWHGRGVRSNVSPDIGRQSPGQKARVSPVSTHRRSPAPRQGPSPRGSPRPRRKNGGPSPRRSGEGTREHGMGAPGPGIGLGVV
ncbi:uncharacterized protein THITE_2121003 [Thermothielavioides terrestris NRRL 8126]|uniref:Uncharacterized protein n=1 Tax=Thermothielavioides terrestris (strain ATCC 38088 / NRRL 8126) TaxID=578455 RepID=G2RE55_THETT|nr:uncharacterized protein THITE_2121003 [Thermothielavioides terrestris NRRL 8126]AEO70082.1 hypothetical protein THITE_2121003 [Thermothielavioides terrestris NRRL 8126]